MRWNCPVERRCLKFAEWPLEDQTLWRDKIIGTGKRLSLTKTVNWRPETIKKRCKGYGRWLTFLKESGADMAPPPCSRVTLDRVRAYVAKLEAQNLARHTIRGRIEELLSVMLAFDRRANWNWLKDIFQELEYEARTTAKHELPKIFPADTILICQRKLREVLASGLTPRRAVAARNAVMIMFLSLVPIRRTNLASLVLGQHIYKDGMQWQFRIPGTEMKGKREFAGEIHPLLGRSLDLYCSTIRPFLLNGAETGRLWVTIDGRPVEEMRVYAEVRKTCRRWFNLDLSPHDFRYIAAQAAVAVDPDLILGAQALLGHTTSDTTRDYYIAADGIRASRMQASVINDLRNGPPARQE